MDLFEGFKVGKCGFEAYSFSDHVAAKLCFTLVLFKCSVLHFLRVVYLKII